ARVTNRLHVADDAFGLWIVAQVMDEVAPAHIEHRTDGDEGAESDIRFEAPVQNRGAERATLADEPDVPAPRHSFREGRVQAAIGRHDPKAIRTDDAHLR